MSNDMKTVLFICEHGSAKSVVAAAQFNRIAAERGLAVTAVSRGTDPDDRNNPVAVQGLAGDRLQPLSEPRKLSREELANAQKIVSFSELPAEFTGVATAEVWDVPPVSAGYEAARNVIVEKVARLVTEMSSGK
jgi:protein-tyrosine-phosphatase